MVVLSVSVTPSFIFNALVFRYYIQLDTDTFNNATYWSATGVNIAAQFIITLTVTSMFRCCAFMLAHPFAPVYSLEGKLRCLLYWRWFPWHNRAHRLQHSGKTNCLRKGQCCWQPSGSSGYLGPIWRWWKGFCDCSGRHRWHHLLLLNLLQDVLKFVEAQKPVCPSEYCCKWCTNNNTNGSSMFF